MSTINEETDMAKTPLEKALQAEKKITAELDSSLAAYLSMQESRMKLHDKLKKAREKVSKIKFESLVADTPEYFQWLLDFDETTVKYNEQGTNFYKATDGMVAFSGYFPETKQNALQLRLESNSDVEKCTSYLSAILPFVLPVKDGFKSISILEKTCSQYGSFDLITNDKKYIITKHVYHRRNDVYTCDTLKDALTYIAKYVNNDDDDEEYEDD